MNAVTRSISAHQAVKSIPGLRIIEELENDTAISQASQDDGYLGVVSSTSNVTFDTFVIDEVKSGLEGEY